MAFGLFLQLLDRHEKNRRGLLERLTAFNCDVLPAILRMSDPEKCLSICGI